MNKKQLQQINRMLSDNRKTIRLQNKQLQKHMVEQNELAFCKMLEYVRDQADFLKSYLNDLRNLAHNEFSLTMIDALQDVIIQSKKDVVVIRRIYEDAKHGLTDEDNLGDLDLIIFHSAELNEIIKSLDRIEKVLLAYPIK